MKKIEFSNVLPEVFREEKIESDIWQKQFTLEVGKTYLIESVSGKGKSSFCSYIYGYRNDYSGTISFDNISLKNIPLNDWDKVRCMQMSLLFQELRLFAELTVMENLMIKNNLTNYKTLEQIEEMLQYLKIENKRHQLIGKMSWGQQQRVAVIRAMCQPYKFVVLDEPISHLDDENAALIAQLVRKEADEQGAAIVVTSIGKHLPLKYDQTFAL